MKESYDCDCGICSICSGQRMPNESHEDAKLRRLGTQPTDAQQLKAAIALVRQYANVLHEAGAYSLNSFLDVIEQRASV